MSDEIKELTLIEALLKMGIDFSRRDYCGGSNFSEISVFSTKSRRRSVDFVFKEKETALEDALKDALDSVDNKLHFANKNAQNRKIVRVVINDEISEEEINKLTEENKKLKKQIKELKKPK